MTAAASPQLAELLDAGRLWRGGAQAHVRAQATGFAALDARLPGGGWPIGALSEIVHERVGVGEIALVAPMLARLTQAGRWVGFVSPPFTPYAPALAQAGIELSRVLVVDPPDRAQGAWAAEQLLRAGAGAVLAWSKATDLQTLRRLQLAAEAADNIALLYRSGSAAHGFSPTALRLRVWREAGSARVEILKCRGSHSAAPVPLAQ
ncbi:MAG TPA: translesion DNA synthesis-associated protein ImuA [Nevskiaceae bacterium]|nr:translesion DNA synthesis-associated protein ImuA [Nevskiaceae bacterium]